MTIWFDNRVELEFPVRPQLFFLARMIATAVATRASFDSDQVNDLRLAVDELLLTLVRGRSPHQRMHVDYEWGPDAVEVVASLYHGQVAPSALKQKLAMRDSVTQRFSESILGAMADQHGVPTDEQVPISWLRVRKRDDPGS